MRHVCLGLVVGLALLVAGCETSVDPIVGSEKAFSLYGVLQPRSDTQWVRVYAVKEQLEPTPPESLAAAVTSTNLERGRERSWRDSLIREDDGRFAHVFWTPTRVDYGRTYQIQVTGEGEQTAQVTVPVPERAALALEEPQAETAPIIAPVRITRSVPRLINVEVEYYVQYDLPENVAGRDDPAIRLSVSYKDVPRPVEEGWIVPIDLSDDYRTLRDQLVDLDLWNPEVGIVMRNMTLRLEVVNEAWDPPGGEFDPNVLVEPGAMSNVEGGFGFVGAGYPLRKRWRPDIEVLERAGWTNPADLY